MIIGAQKAGTTSLKHYLGEHPQLQTHPQKEFSFFTDANEHRLGLPAALKKYFRKQESGRHLIAKNALLYSSPGGLRKLHEHNPDIKLDLILRNPVERTYSAYLMERNGGSIQEPFSELVKLLDDSEEHRHDWRYSLLIGMSRYADHLNDIYSVFPKENISVILFEDFKNNPVAHCRQLFRMVGVDETFTPDVSVHYNETKEVSSHKYARIIKRLLHNENPIKKVAKNFMTGPAAYGVGEMLRNVNRTNRKYPGMDDATRRALLDYFRPQNDVLHRLTGLDVSNWNT